MNSINLQKKYLALKKNKKLKEKSDIAISPEKESDVAITPKEESKLSEINIIQCSNYEILTKEKEKLSTALEKFTKGSTMLKVILQEQK